MSTKKQKRHNWLKQQLKLSGMFQPNDPETIEAFITEFPEAEKSQKIIYNYGSNPCKMLQNDCRELYLKGEFGRRGTVGGGEGSKSYGLGTYSVIYTLKVCNMCNKELDEDAKISYKYGDMQICKSCFELKTK